MPGRTSLLLVSLILASFPLDASSLAREKSPYLRDHADNLVSWSVWGEPAFEKARLEGKPIFLSIGYAACHWCHVMERESFMNPEVAALINEKYVAVLVDREEHPDVDATYIAFLEATQGSAGWPANLILAPDLKPLAGTTYVKPEPLSRFLRSVADRWSTNRVALLASRDQLLVMAAELNAGPSLPASLSEQTAKRQLEILKEAYDSQSGGFGTAPKFPQALAIDFLLRYSVQQKDKDALEMALRTLRAITAGGIHDRIGGGFHRYATDRQWRVPHFEKMLYDQALLAIVLTEAWQLTEERQFLDSTRLTLDFVLRELSDSSGGFYAALDADSAPRVGSATVDGAFYTWTAGELKAVAGNEAGEQLAGGGKAAGEPAGEIVLTSAALDADLRKKLFAARALRPRPAVDDKIITGWNGLMISAMARAGAALEEPRYIKAAVKAAQFVETRLWDSKEQRLHRHHANGPSEILGVAQDYALLTGGFIDLYEASFDVHWLDLALTLQRRQDALFWDEAGRQYRRGGTLSKELSAMAVESDFALPSANSASAMNLTRLGEISDNESWRKRAELILGTFAARLATASDLPQMGSALLLVLGTPKQIVIAGERYATDTKQLINLVNRRFLPNRVLLLVDDASRTRLSGYLPLLRSMKPLRKRATAYVCENYICKLPTSDPGRLKQLLE